MIPQQPHFVCRGMQSFRSVSSLPNFESIPKVKEDVRRDMFIVLGLCVFFALLLTVLLRVMNYYDYRCFLRKKEHYETTGEVPSHVWNIVLNDSQKNRKHWWGRPFVVPHWDRETPIAQEFIRGEFTPEREETYSETY